MTQSRWCSLFLTFDSPPSAQSVAEKLQTLLTAMGYALYNPFGIIPGKSYPVTVRSFIAPPTGNWVRILSEQPLPRRLLTELTVDAIGVDVLFTSQQGDITTYDNGQPDQPLDVLSSYLKSSRSTADIEDALNRTRITLIPPEQESTSIPTQALPDDVRSMAEGVDAQAMSKMFNRVTSKLFSRNDGDIAQANALLAQTQLDWDVPHGRAVRDFLECLTIGEDWQMPTYSALSSAYGLHLRRKRKPNARLYPGDTETMATVPNALDFVPIFAGKDV